MKPWMGVLAGLAAVAAMFASWALVARFVLHGPVDAGSLEEAVVRESGSADQILGDFSSCRRAAAPDGWTCEILDRSGSGTARYSVRVRPDTSCWDARRSGGSFEAPMPRKLSGCVYFWQWTLLDVLE